MVLSNFLILHLYNILSCLWINCFFFWIVIPSSPKVFSWYGIASSDNLTCPADDIFNDVCRTVNGFGGIAEPAQCGIVFGCPAVAIAYALRQHPTCIVGTVGQPLQRTAVVRDVQADVLRDTVYIIAVYIARTFGSRVAAALRSVVSVGGVVFVSAPLEPVQGKSVDRVALFVRVRAGGVVVEGGVFFVSVSGKADGITKIAFNCRLPNEQVAHLVVLDACQIDGAGSFG